MRLLAGLFVVTIVVALIVTAGLSEAARGPHRTHRHAGDPTRRASTALKGTAAPHLEATAATSPIVRPLALAANTLVTTTLQRRILAALQTAGFAGAGSAVCIYDLSSDRLLLARDSATLLRPASNEKLLTSATALARWGPAHRFTTDLYGVGNLAPNGAFRGSLYLKGYGDPSLSTTAYNRSVLHLRSARLEDFVWALRRAGVKRLDGHIVGDASYFDALRAVASWHADELDDCGPLSALSLDEGLNARGRPVTDPALDAAATLTALLRRAHIAVSGAASTGITPPKATLLYEDRSAPLSVILASMNRRSDDFFAEMITKGLGAAFAGSGSTAAGVRLERAYVRAEGIDPDGLVVADGSGLSYADRETSADLVRLLATEAHSSQWPIFYGSLAVAGESGTLADRMRDTPAQGDLHAKTGTLEVASCLSGYVTAANGHLLAFSVLINSDSLDLAAAWQAQDAIGVALARSRPGGRIVWTSPAGA